MKINSKILNDNKKYASESMLENRYELKYGYIDICTLIDSDLYLNKNLHIWISNYISTEEIHQFSRAIDSIKIILHSNTRNVDVENVANMDNIIWLYNLTMLNFGIYHVTEI